VTAPFRQQPGHPDVYRHETLPCPACGRPNNSAKRAQGKPQSPGDGDWSICFGCGEVSVYAVGSFGVALREATGQELREFADNPDNTRLVRDLHLSKGDQAESTTRP